ncbi:MAG: hemolysin family protein [Serratia inhibens]|uniref:hemolysin family protein n=1 Tax=Serratia inhibens TaxID=2338073 RepID=UPI003C7ADDB6
MSLWVIFILVVLILINALYVAAEFAAVGARVSRVEQFAAQGKRLAQALLPIVRDPKRLDHYIAACQIGITLSSLVLGAFGQATLGVALGGWFYEHAGMDTVAAASLAAVVVLVVLTSSQVVLGELIPKTVALQFPVRTAMYTYLPMKWSLTLYTPFIAFLNGSGNLVLRWMKAEQGRGHRHIHSAEELDMLLRESTDEGTIDQNEGKRLRAGLRLARRTAWQLMVPRRDIVGLDLEQPMDELFEQLRRSSYTRMVAYRGSIDNVEGFLHIKDVATHLALGREPEVLPSLLRPLIRLAGDLSADEVLGQLRQHRARLALVIDEYNDVVGLVTLQDLVSEVLGETSDEFKTAENEEPLPLGEHRWRLSGHMAIDDFLFWLQEQGASVRLPEGGFKTLAGLVMFLIDAVPVEGQILYFAGFTLTVEKMRGAALESVIVSRDIEGQNHE